MKLRIFLFSFLMLFLELALIRFLSGYIRLLGFFANIVLLGTFFGMGLGMLWSSSKRNLIRWFPVTFLLFTLATVLNPLDVSPSTKQVIFFKAVDLFSYGVEPTFYLPVIFTVVGLLFASIAQEFGRVFAKAKPLIAYSLDIAGSLAGIVSFTLLSFLAAPSWIWFSVIGIILAFLTFRKTWVWILGTVLPLVLTILIVFGWSRSTYWSPYYKVNVAEYSDGYGVYVNTMPNQFMTRWDNKEPFYYLPYKSFDTPEYKHVLILGSGTGNDVSIVLHENPQVESIDAVEIDPTILALGKTLHPNNPYSDPRVTTYVTDGRYFLKTHDKRYDLIIFALTDSLILASQTSNVRLESFLFTKEAIADARNHLSDRGLLVLYNYYREPWLVDRLGQILATVFETPPYIYRYQSAAQAAIFLAGPKTADLSQTNQSLTKYKGVETLAPATDDWPFLYVRNKGIPAVYISVLLLLAAITLLFVIPTMKKTRDRLDMRFFLLGVAFLLLETKTLVTFSLLFGTTWVVNSLVFIAILSAVLVANLLSVKHTIKPLWILSVALLGVLTANMVVSPTAFLSFEPLARYVLASLFYFTPVFLANLLFSQLFKKTTKSVVSFGSNLIGAVFGGFAEYAALAVGYNALLAIVAFCYIVAGLYDATKNRS